MSNPHSHLVSGPQIKKMAEENESLRARVAELEGLVAHLKVACNGAELTISALKAGPGDPVELAIKFHEAYERLAPSFGYSTRPDTKTFRPDSQNGRLMVAVCAELLHQAPTIPKDVLQNSKRWEYTQQAGYFQTGPYSTDGDFMGYSVGIEPEIPSGLHWKERAKYGGLNKWTTGRGNTLEEAIDEAMLSAAPQPTEEKV